jgi:hypothetical protein
MPRKGSGVTGIMDLRARSKVLRTKPLDCWLWKGAVSHGQPRIWMFDPFVGGMRAVTGPRAAAILGGLEVPAGGRAWMGCANPMCVNPHHVLVGTMAEWGKWIADNGTWRGVPARIAAATATARKHCSKLDMDKAREIRALELPQAEKAALYGVGVDVISDVERGKRWRETTPWDGLLQLGAR